MSPRDCLDLGKDSIVHGYYGQAFQWIEQSFAREGNPSYEKATKLYDQMFQNYSQNGRLTEVPAPEDYLPYQALCRGDALMTPAQEKDLYCYVTNSNNAWLYMQPVKVEVMNRSSSIVMYHQLMTETESNQIRQLASPMLKRAQINDLDNGQEYVSDKRTAHLSYLSDEHEIVSRLNRRVEAITGLSTDMVKEHCEPMQVANYGMAGNVELHHDYTVGSSVNDQTATLMFYLTNVGQGGATVFPRLGVRLTPTKLSAAFWYNLRKNGEVIEDTLHGGCPVLMGDKWIANYWIREIGQTFRRKCSLNPQS